MAEEYTGLDISGIANDDMSGYQYRFVHQVVGQAKMTFDLLGSGTEMPGGILQNDPALGETAVVRYTGTSKLVMGEVIAENDEIVSEWVDAVDNGKGLKPTVDGQFIMARCIQGASAEDNIGSVQLTGPQKIRLGTAV